MASTISYLSRSIFRRPNGKSVAASTHVVSLFWPPTATRSAAVSTNTCATTYHPALHRCQQRTFASNSNDESTNLFAQIYHPASLSLSPLISSPALQSASALPEVSAALDQPALPLSERISSLQRASEVFEQIMKGGSEHCAVLMLLAENLNDVGRYQEAANVIQSLLDFEGGGGGGKSREDEDGFNLQLALTKAYFNGGLMEEAISAAKSALEQAAVVEDASNASLRQGTAMNALDLTRLASLTFSSASNDDIDAKKEELGDMSDEVEECREMLKMASSVLWNETRKSATSIPSVILAAAASSSNEGIADLLYTAVRSKAMGYENVRVDGALSTWKDGLSLLDDVGNSKSAAEDVVRARLHSNIAMALLLPSYRLLSVSDRKRMEREDKKLDEEDLTIASEHARTALKLCDGIIERVGSSNDAEHVRAVLRTISGRSLHLVADCYSRAGSAVTAEGLYQSALEMLDDDRYEIVGGPIAQIERRETYRSYAALCDNWDKRGGDADKMRDRADEVEDGMEKGWSSKPALYGGLWMFTSGDLL